MVDWTDPRISRERTLRRLRTQVEAEQLDWSPKTQAPESPKDEAQDEKLTQATLDRFRLPKKSPTVATTTFSTTSSTGLGLTATSQLDSTSTSLEPTFDEATGAATVVASPAFSASGEGQLCEVTRAKYGRFMHPSRDPRPEAGHYRVNDSCSFQRQPQWDIGQRSRHQGRAREEKPAGAELGDMYNGFADGLARQGKFEPMALAPPRPDMTTLCPQSMTFAPAHQKEWAKLDGSSSRSQRYPDWDFKKHMSGHHFDLHMSFPYFEPGKYDVEMKDTATGLPFSKVMSRAQSAGEMKSGGMGPKNRLLPDRSCFRGCAAAVPRKTCLQDFAQDLDRPPLLMIDAPPYDEDDPEVSQKVLDWQMSFDASTADKLIVSRCATPSMKASLARHQALRGARILGCDPGLQRSLGIGILNLDSKTGTELHDEWRWQRSDMGLAFGQMSGRYSAPSTTRVHSSLRRPKSEVTFSFKRLARPGFTSGVKIPA